MKLAGKKALITGGTEGFGLACAKAFLAEGADVCVCARNVSVEQQQAFPQVKMIVADISHYQEVKRLTQEAMEQMGTIDILVCNAGVHGPLGPFEHANLDAWSEAIDINLKGGAFLCHEMIPHFKQKNRGKIVFVSGGGATKAMPYFSAYAASKAALVRLGETLAEELKPFSIDVNMIAPGAMNTRLLREVLEAGPAKVGENYYRQVVKQEKEGGTPPEKGAALCVFLASPESDGLTGKLISAVWDPWEKFSQSTYKEKLMMNEVYTLRRVVPNDDI